MNNITRKNKVNLADYAYKRDIENRILLAQLSVLEVDLLREIVHSSLRIDLQDLAETLEIPLQQLIPALRKLSATQLFKQEGSQLIVNKEMRKYYESQIEKFDPDFKPDMEFLQGLLNKVSINALPIWYAIPKSSDHIFSSIIEKYLLTPAIYRQYLEEIEFDEPILKDIIRDLYQQAPSFKLETDSLIKKYNLTREKLEEYVLLLEYHFVCCIKYEQVNNEWHEFISPFQEWLEYLQFETASRLVPIEDQANIQLIAGEVEFGFIHDMETILKACQEKGISTDTLERTLKRTESHFNHVLFKLKQLEFISEKQLKWHITSTGKAWLNKTLTEKSSTLTAHPLNTLKSLNSYQTSLFYNPRNSRLIEQSLLGQLGYRKWVYLEDFIKGLLIPIGKQEGISLKNKGKKWKYTLPSYSEDELHFIQAMITERLFELGIVAIGKHKDKTCFTLTSFGRVTLH